MDSLEILEFKSALKNYIASKSYPAIVKQMILNELLIEINQETDLEVTTLFREREEKKKKEEN